MTAITRRAMLAAPAGATVVAIAGTLAATLTSAWAAPPSDTDGELTGFMADQAPDPCLALYAEWAAAEADGDALNRRFEVIHAHVAEAYGAPRPRTLMFEPIPGRPLHYVEFDTQADEATRAGEWHTSIGTREQLKANLEAERQRWRSIEEGLGLPPVAAALEAADRRAGQAHDRLRDTPATTPAGAALKLRAALSFITNTVPGAAGEAPEELEWKGFNAVIRDLDAMEAQS